MGGDHLKSDITSWVNSSLEKNKLLEILVIVLK